MIFEAYTTSDPWTVMIHFEDTPLAETAVMSSRRLYLLALLTPPILHEVTVLKVEVHVSIQVPAGVMVLKHISDQVYFRYLVLRGCLFNL